MTDWRKCRTCLVEQPAANFWKQPNRRDGLQTECKVCNTARQRKWVDANRERYRELNNAATRTKRKNSPERQILWSARARAKKRGLKFNLTVEDVVIPDACPVLGIPIIHYLGNGDGARRPESPSLDRINNDLGYVKGNVIVISWRANRLKNDATLEELRAIVGFYEQLATSKTGEATMPAVQPHKEE